MATRRELLLMAFAVPLVRGARRDFWNQSEPSQWSEEEIKRLLADSPWARSAEAEFNMEGMGGPPGMGPPDGGGPPGMGGEGPGQFRLQVRWESAEPLLVARKQAVEEGRPYIIAVTGMPGPPPGERRPGRMKETTTLQAKGKTALVPHASERREEDYAMVFTFAREPIVLEDKEVQFRTRMGPLEIKVKFVLRDMLYHGRLAL